MSESLGLHEVFAGRAGPGLHRLDRALSAGDLAEAASSHAWVPIVARLAGATDKTTVIDRLAEAGHFPDYTARNWDALQDALGDLSWLGPADGFMVVLEDWDTFTSEDPSDARVVESVLAHAATEWSARGTPMVALTV